MIGCVLVVDYAGKDLLDATGRGNSVTVLVDQVLNAGMLRVTLLPMRQSVIVYVAGIMAPKSRAKSINGDEHPEPYFLQSKFFTEMRALSR